jgi:membrane protein required for colicin V production
MQTASTDPVALLAGFNAVDWVLLAILLWSTISAFFRGFFRELFALVGLFIGILLAGLYYLPVAARLRSFITTAAIREIVAFLLIALGTMVCAGLLGRLLQRTASLIGLGFFDRLLGAVFGAARGCLEAVALITVLAALLPTKSALKNSRLAPYFLAGAHGVSFVVPQGLEQQITDGISRIRQTDQAR